MREIPIHQIEFITKAFGRNITHIGDDQDLAHLDLETGEIVWAFSDNEQAVKHEGITREENQNRKVIMKNSPERYLKIPFREKDEHHYILHDFLTSKHSGKEELTNQAIRSFSDPKKRRSMTYEERQVVIEYYKFRFQKLVKMAEKFLNEHEIKPLWI